MSQWWGPAVDICNLDWAWCASVFELCNHECQQYHFLYSAGFDLYCASYKQYSPDDVEQVRSSSVAYHRAMLSFVFPVHVLNVECMRLLKTEILLELNRNTGASKSQGPILPDYVSTTKHYLWQVELTIVAVVATQQTTEACRIQINKVQPKVTVR